MMYITHMAVALFAGLLKVKLIPLPINKYVFLAIVVISALLPDIDYDSFIARKLKLRFVRFFFAHRGFFHSILPMIFFMILAFLITGSPYYSFAVLIGFGSHLAFDSITMKGVAWFWPSKLRAKGPLRTGGIIDKVLLMIFILMDIVMVVVVF